MSQFIEGQRARVMDWDDSEGGTCQPTIPTHFQGEEVILLYKEEGDDAWWVLPTSEKGKAGHPTDPYQQAWSPDGRWLFGTDFLEALPKESNP